MYSRLKLKDATRSMISNNDKVLMTLEDENINILHIETDINTADTLIQHFSNQHHVFIKDNIKEKNKKSHSKNIKLTDLFIYKQLPMLIEDRQQLDFENNINQPINNHFTNLYSEITDIEKYSESLSVNEVKTYISEFDFKSKEIIELISITILVSRLIKEIENVFTFDSLLELISSKEKLISTINEISNRDDLFNYSNASFLFEEWNNINSIDDSTFDEFKKLFESLKVN